MKREHRDDKKTASRAPIAIGNGEKLTTEQAAAVKDFVNQLGGIENARRAVAALQELKKAA